ncbi:hypothetical protein T11_2013 [Trichinella zimbabwensis]|uniref:Uncharacterized protein n=1 Tax=Trichinella zimbabwensis TaxID=268475 RepID=A0A0V1H0Y8_9BILA|nr:hypothetical protein T11_2013 [Trichinella zimbabwensis]
MYGKEIPNTLDNTSASSEQAYQKFLRKKIQAGRPAEAQLSKSGRCNLAHGCWKVALNDRDQGCFEITKKFRRIKSSAWEWSTSNIRL